MPRKSNIKKLYEKVSEETEIIRQKVIETPSNYHGKGLNPMFIRYSAQLDILLHMKEMMYDIMNNKNQE